MVTFQAKGIRNVHITLLAPQYVSIGYFLRIELQQELILWRTNTRRGEKLFPARKGGRFGPVQTPFQDSMSAFAVVASPGIRPAARHD
jgi:hypothetical protein